MRKAPAKSSWAGTWCPKARGVFRLDESKSRLWQEFGCLRCFVVNQEKAPFSGQAGRCKNWQLISPLCKENGTLASGWMQLQTRGTWFDKGGKGEQRLDFILGSMPLCNSPTIQSLDLECKQTRAKWFWLEVRNCNSLLLVLGISQVLTLRGAADSNRLGSKLRVCL